MGAADVGGNNPRASLTTTSWQPCVQYGLETHLLSNALLSALGVDGAGMEAKGGSQEAQDAAKGAAEWAPVLEVSMAGAGVSAAMAPPHPA